MGKEAPKTRSVDSLPSRTALDRLHAAAGLSLRAVARELDAAGMRSRTGRPFAAVQVQRMTAA